VPGTSTSYCIADGPARWAASSASCCTQCDRLAKLVGRTSIVVSVVNLVWPTIATAGFIALSVHLYSGVTATPGAPAPPEGPRVLGAPARGKEKIFLFTFRLVIKRIKIYKILNSRVVDKGIKNGAFIAKK